MSFKILSKSKEEELEEIRKRLMGKIETPAVIVDDPSKGSMKRKATKCTYHIIVCSLGCRTRSLFFFHLFG